MQIPELIIDPGHGGSDPGTSANGIVEKQYVLELSLYQYRRFQELGVPVALTHDTDVTLDPAPRTAIVRNSGAKYCISNHVNAGGGDGAEGIYSLHGSPDFANALMAEVKQEGQNERRVFTRPYPGTNNVDYYFMHRETGAVETVIFEYGFVDSNLDDVEQLKTKQLTFAEAVVEGYCKFTNRPYIAPNTVQQKPENDYVNHWAHDAIVAVKGIMNGYEDGTFRPDAQVTRAELATVVQRLLSR